MLFIIIFLLFQDPGVILIGADTSESSDFAPTASDLAHKVLDLNGGGDDTDSDVDVHRPVSPCNVVFVGANVDTGKSSIRQRPKAKKVSTKTSQEMLGKEINFFPKSFVTIYGVFLRLPSRKYHEPLEKVPRENNNE